jgi:hypothetical protein
VFLAVIALCCYSTATAEQAVRNIRLLALGGCNLKRSQTAVDQDEDTANDETEERALPEMNQLKRLYNKFPSLHQFKTLSRTRASSRPSKSGRARVSKKDATTARNLIEEHRKLVRPYGRASQYR